MSTAPQNPCRLLPARYVSGCALLGAGLLVPLAIAAVHNLVTCGFLVLPPEIEPSLTDGGKITAMYAIEGSAQAPRVVMWGKRDATDAHAALAHESPYWTSVDRLWQKLTVDQLNDLPLRSVQPTGELAMPWDTPLTTTGDLHGYGVGYVTSAGEPRTLLLIEDRTRARPIRTHEITLARRDGAWTSIRSISLGFRSINPDENIAFPQVWLLLTVVLLPTFCLAGAGVLASRRRIIAKRAAASQCVYCAYDLRGAAAGVCPECGSLFSLQSQDVATKATSQL